MADTMQRQWAMLKMIPKSPHKIDTHTLRSQLAGMGYPTTLRTIQRDLEALSAIFPLVGTGPSRRAGRGWRTAASSAFRGWIRMRR